MKMQYRPLPQGQLHLSGELGKMLDRIVANRLLKVDYAHLVEPFRKRYENDGLWRCEFWGKIVRSAILAWRATGNAELLAKIESTVQDILSTQTADGCII